MKKRLSLILLCMVATAHAQSDYYIRKAQGYQREAEYYQRQAEGHRREAAYHLKKAESYQREVEYYIRKENTDKVIYDLSGRKVNNANAKGVFIVGGKVVVK